AGILQRKQVPIQEAQRFGVVPPELPPRSGHRALAKSPRIASMPPTGLLPLPGERLLPLALMFRQSCKNVGRRLPLRRVDQVIRKTLLKKLDDIRIRCFALHLPCEVTLWNTTYLQGAVDHLRKPRTTDTS